MEFTYQIFADGSLIRGTGGPSTGLVPMLRVFYAIARYVNQGGKRKDIGYLHRTAS